MLKTGRKFTIGAATLAVALGLSLGAAPSAMAETTTSADLGTSDEAMMEVWTEYGVASETQLALLQKLHEGGAIDSMTGATPTSSETFVEGAKQTVVSRYADGSISVSSIEPANSLARSVGECVVDAPTYAQDCRVHGWFGTIELSFVSSYRKQDLSAMVYNWNQAAFICGPLMTCSDPKFELVRQVQSGSLAAQVNLYTDWNVVAGNGRATLSLFAKDRSAWSN